jgi:hypothetical protein
MKLCCLLNLVDLLLRIWHTQFGSRSNHLFCYLLTWPVEEFITDLKFTTFIARLSGNYVSIQNIM